MFQNAPSNTVVIVITCIWSKIIKHKEKWYHQLQTPAIPGGDGREMSTGRVRKKISSVVFL